MLKQTKTVSNKDGGTKAVSPQEPAKKQPKTKCNRRVVDLTLEDVVDFLGTLPARSFKFVLTGEGCVGLGPTFGSALDLLLRAYGGECAEFSGLLAEGESAEEMAKKKSELWHSTIVLMVEKEVRLLKGAGASFVLCWRVAGDAEPRLDCSQNHSRDSARTALFHAVQQEISQRINFQGRIVAASCVGMPS